MKITLFAFLILGSLRAFSGEVIPGLIPRFYSIEAATDLPISPDEAHARALGGFDISTLDPKPGTNIWDKNSKAIPTYNFIKPDETVRFVKTLPSRNGQLRFSVQTNRKQELIVILSKKVHNTLMRRNILAKLGYMTQPMGWVPQLKIDFVDTIDRDLFKEDMKDKLLAGTERWVKKEEDLLLTIQDALVQTPDTNIYNLATGVMGPEIHQGRRLLRAPYVPLALVDSTESVNLFPWLAGRVVLDNIKLNHTLDLDTGFGASWEDARWIGRRMGKLSREDFAEIVSRASYPAPVAKLMTEKLIARRNSLMEMLELDQEFPKIEFNPSVSEAPALVDGEIVQEFFDGYSSRFSYGDPESPFSSSELGSYAIGRVQSEVMNTAISQLNTLLGSDDEANYKNEIMKIINNEGPYFNTQGVLIPTFHGSLILSRDIVTGTYLGTNNKVQLVDNFGVSLDAGVYAGVEGIPMPMTVKAGASLVFQRVFSHIKPIQTLKKSLKEPYKNMMVPLLLKGIGDKIDKLSVTQTGPEADAALGKVISELKSSLAVGESFIITDSLVPNVFADSELSLSGLVGLPKDALKLYGKVQSQRMMLTRFHLHRADENTFHIYQDYGKSLKLQLTFKLRSYIPIVAFNARWSGASSETKFFPITMTPKAVTVKTLKALRQSLFALNHSALEEQIKPHKVENKIKENANTFEFFFYKQNKIGSLQDMKLTHALGGKQKEIYRRYDATTAGIDFEGYGQETVNYVLKALLNSNLSLEDVQTLNPGFTVGGKAKNKVFTSEHDGDRLSVSYQRILNGWKVSSKKINSLLTQLNREAGVKIFDPITVVNTNSILLYQISFNYLLTQEGSDRLLQLKDAQLRSTIQKYAYTRVEDLDKLVNDLMRDLEKLAPKLKHPDPSSGMKDLHAFLRKFQNTVTVRGLETIVGDENLAYQGKVEGFRQGDENGDSPIFTNVYGDLPLPLQMTPTQAVQNNWGILEGELLSNWMMERAI